jgi:SulP family sulfate permease
VVLSGVTEAVHQVLLKNHIDKLIGEDHICPHITVAVKMANKIAATRNAATNSAAK